MVCVQVLTDHSTYLLSTLYLTLAIDWIELYVSYPLGVHSGPHLRRLGLWWHGRRAGEGGTTRTPDPHGGHPKQFNGLNQVPYDPKVAWTVASKVRY